MFESGNNIEELKYKFLENPKKDFSMALTSPDFFERQNIYFIETQNGQYIKDYCVNEKFHSFSDYYRELETAIKNKTTFKIEGFEYFNQNIFNFCNSLYTKFNKPVNCHAYFGYEGQGSFDLHTDPCEVIIANVYGQKELLIDDYTYHLPQNHCIYIPANTQHKAKNVTDCLSLSFGTFDFDCNDFNAVGIDL
jgi:mannose-6-phosphate isomerase-like protein (cupin superfamily)